MTTSLNYKHMIEIDMLQNTSSLRFTYFKAYSVLARFYVYLKCATYDIKSHTTNLLCVITEKFHR